MENLSCLYSFEAKNALCKRLYSTYNIKRTELRLTKYEAVPVIAPVVYPLKIRAPQLQDNS